MNVEPFSLERWFQEYAFTTSLMLCSSGVEEFSFGELRQLLSLTLQELDHVIFTDSPSHGSPGLRKVLAERWGTGNQEEVMATHGSSEAIFLVMNALLKEHDELVILTPCYQALYSIPKALGCQIIPWRLQFAQQFVPDIAEVESLVTSRTRMIVVNFPNNPTGVSISASHLDALIDIASSVGAYLLWDAAFNELSYNSPPLPNPCLKYDRAISLGTLSKAYGLTGLRVGWCFASPEILARCSQLRDYVTLNLSPLIELIAQRVVQESQKVLHIHLQQAKLNLEILTQWIEQHQEMVGWVPPQGGVSAFLRLSGISDTEAFCRRLADTYGVFLLPGTCFGYPEHVRLGFGGPTIDLKEGLSRLSALLHEVTSSV